jgi:uncharacterized protein (TIGR03437 family)
LRPDLSILCISWLCLQSGFAATVVASKSATINFTELAAAEPPAAARPRRNARRPRRIELRNPDMFAERLPAAATAAPPPMATAPAPFALTGFAASLDTLTVTPPDCAGAVGPQHVVTMLNDVVQLQQRNGAVLSHVRPETFWASLAPFIELTDPRVVYDAPAARWVAVIAADPETKNSALFLAVSKTADPAGAWYLQRFPGGGAVPGSATDFFWTDFPSLGVNKNWVVVTVNSYRKSPNQNSQFAQSNIYAFNKAKLYAAMDAPHPLFQDQTAFFGFAPATDYDNSGDTFYLVGVDSEFLLAQSLRVTAIQGPVGSETYARKPQVFAPAPWEQIPAAGLPQPGTPSSVDGGDDRMLSCVLRNASLWCAHTVFPVRTKRAAVQWFQIDTASFQIQQTGRIDDPNNVYSYVYPSIAVNKNGDVLIGYSEFSTGKYPSANYSLRLAGDPPNSLRDDTLFKQGEAHYSGFRWGDFSTTVVDPVDATGFWTLQEYAASPSAALQPQDRWGTWWAQIVSLGAGAAPCTYSLAQASQSVAGAGGTAAIGISAMPACPWMAASNVSWITIQDGTPGTGPGTVHLSVAPNTSIANSRTGTVTAAGQTFTVTQAPATSLPDLVISDLTAPSSATIGGQINVSATLRNMGGVRAQAFRTAFYLSSSSTPDPIPPGAVFCTLDKGLDAFASSPCSVTITVPLSAMPGTVYLAAVVDDQNLIPEAELSNNLRQAESGPIALSFDPARPLLSAAGIVHAATLRSGAVSPGLIVLVSAANAGPSTQTPGASDASGKLNTTIAGTQLLFDSVAAPLLSAGPGRLQAIVPYAVAGNKSTQVQVSSNGVLSNSVTVPVVDAAPGLFAVNAASGQAAAVNEDGSNNSPDNPAAAGSAVTLLASGEGQTDPPGVDGQFAADVIPAPRLQVEVMIGGQEAEIVSAGGIAGQVAGFFQVSVRVPDGVTPAAAAPVVLSVGGIPSQAGVTIAVQ